MSVPNLSLDQKRVLRDIVSWYKSPQGKYLTVGGYAGTGKTTLMALFRKLLYKHRSKTSVAFATLTGKASQVLQNSLALNGALYDQDTCGTIHSLIYRPNVDTQGHISGWYRNKELSYDLIIVDEASMVTGDIWSDLQSYGIPIIAVGDHGQLPPVGDSFNLMEQPQLRLQTIHRQAADSPIIQLATQVRLNGQLPPQTLASNVRKFGPDSYEGQDILEQTITSSKDQLVLCARNKTRIKLNQFVRGQKYFESEEPQVGDSLICLKNYYENKEGPIYNGMIGSLSRISPHEEHWYDVIIDFPQENRQFTGLISRYQFNQEQLISQAEGVPAKRLGERFDFGYAMTVHKAQGSQAETVIIYEENAQVWMRDNYSRWLYTAITRATDNVYIFP